MFSPSLPLLATLSALALATGPAQAQPMRLSNSAELHRRDAGYTQLADGTYMQSGEVSDTFRWQASGTLDHGSCASIAINDCYRIMLGADGNLQSTKKPDFLGGILRKRSAPADVAPAPSFLARATSDDTDLDAYYAWLSPTNNSTDEIGRRRRVAGCAPPPSKGGPSPPPVGGGVPVLPPILAPPGGGGHGHKQPSARQRVELFSWPGAAAGERFTYTWKSRLLTTSSSGHFFHTWQLLSRSVCGKGAPVVTLDLFNGSMVIDDNGIKCQQCTSSPLADWFNVTVTHTMSVTYGAQGSIQYQAQPTEGGPQLLSYQSNNRDMGDQGSVKFGSYRLFTNDLEPVINFVGDYSATKH